MKFTEDDVAALFFLDDYYNRALTVAELYALYQEFLSSSYNRAELDLETCLEMFVKGETSNLADS